MRPTRAITGTSCEMEFPTLAEPKDRFNTGKARYSGRIKISGNDNITLLNVNKAMEAARQAGKDKLCDDNGKVPPLSDLKTPLHYNDEDNTYNINAYSTRRPEVVDRNKEKLDPAEVHPGAFVRVVLDFYAYRHGDKCGIACTLALVQKIKDGERPVYGSALDDLPDLDGDGSDDDDDDDGILP